jgi:hypothetical protein
LSLPFGFLFEFLDGFVPSEMLAISNVIDAFHVICLVSEDVSVSGILWVYLRVRGDIYSGDISVSLLDSWVPLGSVR